MTVQKAPKALVRRLEPLLEALPGGIVDAHHHVWNLTEGSYPWLQEAYQGDRFFLGPYRALCQDYTTSDLRRDTAPLSLAASVHIEAERDRSEQLHETRWLERTYGETGLPSVIVGHVSFLQADLVDVLREHVQSPLFRGVRSKPVTSAGPGQTVAGQPGSMQDDRWLAGLAALQAHGLSWDLRVPFWHLLEAASVAAALPGIPMIVNHCGLPLDRSDDGLDLWRRGLAALALHPNVFLKLSEFGLSGGVWDEPSTIRVAREAAAIFGLDRVLYGSNLPVSSLSASVPRIATTILRALDTNDPHVLTRVFSSNARRVYRISAEQS